MGLLDKELRAAKKIVSAIATLPARIAELPVLQEQASAMRDALPSEYQGIDELGDIPEKLDPDLTQRIIGTVEADAKYQDAKLAIHDDRALIGLGWDSPRGKPCFWWLYAVIGDWYYWDCDVLADWDCLGFGSAIKSADCQIGLCRVY